MKRRASLRRRVDALTRRCVDVSLRRRVVASTCRRVDASTCRIVNALTHRRFDASTRRHVDALTRRRVDALTRRRVDGSTRRRVEASTRRRVDASMLISPVRNPHLWTLQTGNVRRGSHRAAAVLLAGAKIASRLQFWIFLFISVVSNFRPASRHSHLARRIVQG